MSDYDLLREFAPREKPKEQHDSESEGHDHLHVAKAIEHSRPDTLSSSATAHLQRLAGNAATSALVAQREEDPSLVHQVIAGGGSALDDQTRSKMESSFGHDFSSVKVHQGPDAAAAAKSVQAQAFTVGNDIVLGDGKSTSDAHTLAHELTHVVQQRSGDVPGTSIGGGIKLSDPGDWAEREAESTADAVMSAPTDTHAGHDHGADGGTGAVQREAMPDEEEEVEKEETAQTLRLQREAAADENEELPGEGEG